MHRGGGLDKARDLAKQKGALARQSLECLRQTPVRHSLEKMVDYVLERLY